MASRGCVLNSNLGPPSKTTAPGIDAHPIKKSFLNRYSCNSSCLKAREPDATIRLTPYKPQLTPEQIWKLQAKFARFRILVIGRANAGKTTILQRLCNTTGEPTIFSPNGQKIESLALNPSMGRGEHDIKNQMISGSNPGFIFHDSRGFEAGGADELKMVQQFIKECSKAKKLKEQLHAIWCVSTCL
ncbi:hypothetical protein BYT27DRAFT_7264201 [Phlegmacium glaucopus]|nr:hypothetical protein BYT27DRAFT_7264201 [Phlegmacium glaucopus]